MSSSNGNSSVPRTAIGFALFFGLIIGLLFLIPGHESEGESSGKARVVVTIPPMAWLVSEIAGDHLEVHQLLSAGSSPHTYELSPDDAKAIEGAIATIYVHEPLDGWALKTRGARAIQIAKLLDSRYFLAMGEHLHYDEHGNAIVCNHDHSDGSHHEHGTVALKDADPHFWMDASLMAELCMPLANQLGAIDPERKNDYLENAKKVRTELRELDDEIHRALRPLRGTALIQFHPSLNYFFARYGLRDAGVVELFPGKEPSPQYLKELIQSVEGEGARAVCLEPQLPDRAGLLLSREAGIPSLRVDPLGGGEGLRDYPALLRYNTRQILSLKREE